jgi:hypothetical protein
LDHLPGSFFGPSNLVDLLRHRASHQPQDVAFYWLADGENEEVSWTYAELDRRARAIGGWLQSLKLQGERALLLYPAGLDFVAAFFGCVYAGVVAVPAYPPRKNRSLERIEAIAGDADAKVALTTEEVLGRVQGVLDQNPSLKSLHWCATDVFPAGMEAPGRRTRRYAGLSAVHVGFHRHAKGRDAQPCELDAQLGADLLRLRAHTQRRRRLLAAQLSRHGPDRRYFAAHVLWAPQCAHVAHGVSAKAGPVAPGDHQIQGHGQRRTELRV